MCPFEEDLGGGLVCVLLVQRLLVRWRSELLALLFRHGNGKASIHGERRLLRADIVVHGERGLLGTRIILYAGVWRRCESWSTVALISTSTTRRALHQHTFTASAFGIDRLRRHRYCPQLNSRAASARGRTIPPASQKVIEPLIHLHEHEYREEKDNENPTSELGFHHFRVQEDPQ